MKKNSIAKDMKSFLMIAFIASFLTSNAYAAGNKEECASEISAAEQLMLTSKITFEQLAEVDKELQSAGKLCAAGDFAAATAKIEENVALMQAAGN